MNRTLLGAPAPTATACLGLFLLAGFLAAQPTGGLTREQMWWAPTAEDWKLPCLITWQRTWDDAVALSQDTKKAILVCVNMDGEIASEHYAGVRYRKADIAELYKPYVTVIASTYRHSPHDYDEQGQRVLCPRFGSVTCGEHIAIEPILYEKFLDGQRVAPRHIMVELDGKEVYDVFYAWDTDSVFKAIKDGISERKITPPPVVRGDRSIIERVKSRDIVDRIAVENAFLKGDKALKQALLEAAAALGKETPVELLRLAVHGFDSELGRRARDILVQSMSPASIDLISEALRAPMNAQERDALVDTLAKLGEQSDKARRLSAVHGGLSGSSKAMDAEGWAKSMGSGTYSPASETIPVALIERQDEVVQRKSPEECAALAEAFLAQAMERIDRGGSDRGFVEALLQDAKNTALEAEKGGAQGWRVNAVLALVALRQGEAAEAHRRAEAAVKGMPEHPTSENAAVVLALFAEARHDAIVKAVESKGKWPGEWLADMHAAHTLLLSHPLGEDHQAASHYDFLVWLGAAGQAARFLNQSLDRFPESPLVHERVRASALRRRGVEGLTSIYDDLLKKEGVGADMHWFAGYAAVQAAEFHRRRQRSEEALAAYDRAIAAFDRFVEMEPERRDSADALAAMALGGKARVALESAKDAEAVGFVLASFERKDAAAAHLDGLNISTVDTAKMLLSRLQNEKKEDLASSLKGAMDKLDPKLLALPAYEGQSAGGRGNPPGAGRRPRRNR